MSTYLLFQLTLSLLFFSLEPTCENDRRIEYERLERKACRNEQTFAFAFVMSGEETTWLVFQLDRVK